MIEEFKNEEEIKNEEIQKSDEITQEIKFENPEAQEGKSEAEVINKGETIDEKDEKKLEENKDVIIDEGITMNIFITALKVGIKDEDLPLEPSILLMIMYQCKRDLLFNISLSPFRKIGKLLDHAAEIGIIDYKQPKGVDHKQITSIARFHPLYVACSPYVSKPKVAKQVEGDKDNSLYPVIVFTPVLIPNPKTFQFLHKNNFDSDTYTKQEMIAVIQEYVKIHNLSENAPSKNQVILNPELAEILKVPPGPFAKSEISKKFSENFFEGFIEEETSGMHPPLIKRGQIPVIRISSKNRTKRKIITSAKGCEAYGIDLKNMATNCQKHFSCQCAVVGEHQNQTNSPSVLQIQGERAEDLVSLLTKEYKVPKQYITIKEGKKKGK